MDNFKTQEKMPEQAIDREGSCDLAAEIKEKSLLISKEIISIDRGIDQQNQQLE